MPKFVALSSLLLLLAGCPTSHGELFLADEPPPAPESLPELPADGFCARLIEYDQRGTADVGVDAVGTVVYDERGRYIRYQEDWVRGGLQHVIVRLFDGDRLLAVDHDHDGDGSVDVSDAYAYDEGDRTQHAVHTGPDGQTRTRTVRDELGRLAGVWTDRDEDGDYEQIRRYEWADRMVTVTTTRPGGTTTGQRILLGADGLVDAIELTSEGETTSVERFRREGARVFQRTLGPDPDSPRWVSSYAWDGDLLVGEIHDDTETEATEQSVALEYDGAGRLSRRLSMSPTGDHWEAIVSFSYDDEGRLSGVVVRDAEDRETWRSWRIITNCPAGFAHGVPVHPMAEYETFQRTTPNHVVDLANAF